MNQKTAYTLIVEANATRHDPHGIIRLRHILKRLLRNYGMKCKSVEVIEDGTKPETQTQEAQK